MKKHSISFSSTGLFSNLFLDYINSSSDISSLISYEPKLESFSSIISDRVKTQPDRRTLVKVLISQYSRISTPEKLKANINSLLDDNAFTVCTAHQLNIFTGPLYIIYKAISVLKLADQLNEKYSDYKVVPVFYLGSEDHDLEEIQSFNLFGQKYGLESEESGATGRMSAAGLKDVYSLFSERLRNEDIKSLLENHYIGKENLADATRSLLNALFGEKGLVVLDGDDVALKESFNGIIKQELIESLSYNSVQKNLTYLKKNYKVQATPREINLFYLIDSLRERIIREGDRWKVLNTDISWNELDLISELEKHPERFSPNVILRPLYQEFILPNLAYVGGAGELSYWLQLRDVFASVNVNFPMLLPRDMNLIIDERKMSKWNGFGFSIEDLFSSEVELSKNYVNNHSEISLDLGEEKDNLKKLIDSIKAKAKKIDASLMNTADAEGAKMIKSIDGLEKRIQKSEKKKYEVELNQVNGLLTKLFPSGGPQERSENILSYLDKYGLEFLDELYEMAEPLDLSYSVIVLGSK